MNEIGVAGGRGQRFYWWAEHLESDENYIRWRPISHYPHILERFFICI